MDSLRFGLGIRALRRRRGLRQLDVAAAVGVSQSWISCLERGALTGFSVGLVERIANALGGRIEVRLLWQGEALDRLLDAAHAGLVDDLVVLLAAAGWECRTEVTFNVQGERGSIDILAREPITGAVLVVEAKSVVPDLQAMQASLDRKARIAPAVALGLGWARPPVVGRLLAVRDARTARRRVEEHAATFSAAFPARARATRLWLQNPTGNLRGLVFLPNRTGPHAGRQRRTPGR